MDIRYRKGQNVFAGILKKESDFKKGVADIVE